MNNPLTISVSFVFHGKSFDTDYDVLWSSAPLLWHTPVAIVPCYLYAIVENFPSRYCRGIARCHEPPMVTGLAQGGRSSLEKRIFTEQKIPLLFIPARMQNAPYIISPYTGFQTSRDGASGSKILAGLIGFMSSGCHEFYMDSKVTVFLVICIAAVSAAGCTTQSAGPVNTTTPQASLPRATHAITAVPDQVAESTRDSDCVPAGCCHPSRCIPGPQQNPCTLLCTAVCEGPLDCGAGSCGCVNRNYTIIPSSLASEVPVPVTAISVTASPRRYSPLMSSTPGIGVEPEIMGFSADNATFTWNATYGQFLSWNSPDFRVNPRGDSATNHGEMLYWSFIDKPSSTEIPVTITVTATDTGSGRVLCSSTVTLAWDGDYAVIVTEIE